MATSACNNSLIFALKNHSSNGNPSKTLTNFPSTPFSSPSLSIHLSPTTTATTITSFSKSPLTLKTLKPSSPPKSSSKTSDLALPDTNPKTLKSRLADGETLYGLFLLSFSPTLAEIAGLAGYDFVVVDMEHGHGGISDALPCLHALAATGTPAILRLPESSPTWAKKALDLGPQGIMFPMIDGPKSAKKAVSYCKFPPAGVRGSAHTVVRASNYGINDGYLTNYEDELLIMCQVESEEAVKKIEEIAKVDGVDCIQMGPLDLSADLGYLWDPGNKKVREMMRAAEKGVLGTKGGDGGGGAYLAGFAMPHDSPEQLRMRGYHMISGAVDVGLFRSVVVEDVKRFKMGLMKGSDDEEGDEKDKDEKYWSE
ncbi:Aldehyde-lyase domain [Macleaya cordata]|uniref:Aldehyde-lyase domain n=1 Tax=Macleaya cordata TaxID=56857 RepID=A0A200QWC4_MACCD|nr:Aldehyde-lyase domain [Macleaya cordata]